MNAYWKLETHGDPLAVITQFIQALWIEDALDLMIVSPDGHGAIIDSPDQVALVNPFHPMMEINLARLIAQTVEQHTGKHIGILLRPCELRALNEMAARGVFSMNNLLTICYDCLGTYAVDEVKWREERLTHSKDITEETLRFAPQGGIAAYRYRPACQVCVNPGATEGMVNIGVIGLPVRQEIIIQANSSHIHLEKITHGTAEEEFVLRREKMLERIIERHRHTRALMIDNLETNLPDSLESLIDHLQSCGDCQHCMDVCPICSIDYPRRMANHSLVKEDVIHWLVSCIGCGMCEQACPKTLPLTAIFNRIRDQLDSELTL